ncbi:hypothetical protein BDR04DRAFT_1097181, partial [Suillus decipiens]
MFSGILSNAHADLLVADHNLRCVSRSSRLLSMTASMGSARSTFIEHQRSQRHRFITEAGHLPTSLDDILAVGAV